MAKKQLKQLQKDILGLTGAGVGLGVGSRVISAAAGTPIAATASGGLAAVSEQMPTLGTVVGLKPIMGMLGELDPFKGKKKPQI